MVLKRCINSSATAVKSSLQVAILTTQGNNLENTSDENNSIQEQNSSALLSSTPLNNFNIPSKLALKTKLYYFNNSLCNNDIEIKRNDVEFSSLQMLLNATALLHIYLDYDNNRIFSQKNQKKKNISKQSTVTKYCA